MFFICTFVFLNFSFAVSIFFSYLVIFLASFWYSESYGDSPIHSSSPHSRYEYNLSVEQSHCHQYFDYDRLLRWSCLISCMKANVLRSLLISVLFAQYCIVQYSIVCTVQYCMCSTVLYVQHFTIPYFIILLWFMLSGLLS